MPDVCSIEAHRYRAAVDDPDVDVVRRAMDPVLSSLGFHFAGVASVVNSGRVQGREYAWVGSFEAIEASFPVTAASVEYAELGPEAVTVRLATDVDAQFARLHIDGAEVARTAWNAPGTDVLAVDERALATAASELSSRSRAEVQSTL